MLITELNRKQLDELKEKYFYSDDYDPKTVGNDGLPILFAGDIPDKVMFSIYYGIDLEV